MKIHQGDIFNIMVKCVLRQLLPELFVRNSKNNFTIFMFHIRISIRAFIHFSPLRNRLTKPYNPAINRAIVMGWIYFTVSKILFAVLSIHAAAAFIARSKWFTITRWVPKIMMGGFGTQAKLNVLMTHRRKGLFLPAVPVSVRIVKFYGISDKSYICTFFLRPYRDINENINVTME